MSFLRNIADNSVALAGKTVLLRVDFNAPMQGGLITDDTRIRAALPTLNYLLKQGVKKVILISHLGRPKGYDLSASMAPVAAHFAKLIEEEVAFIPGVISSEIVLAAKTDARRIAMLDNLRFDEGESSNSREFANILAQAADIYVNEAFSCSHRAHASVEAITNYLPAYGGINLTQEVENLVMATSAAVSPVMAIVGGAKISTKLDLLTNLITKLDYLAIGGAMANNFFLAQGYSVGKSLVEPELLGVTLNIIQQAQKYNCHLILPTEVVTANALNAKHSEVKPCADIKADEGIFDLAPASIEQIAIHAQKCKMVVWNGPVGAFEFPLFANGSVSLAHHLASLGSKNIKVIAGGGDTLSAINKARAVGFHYLSTAGGAFLEWLEGKKLPGIEALLIR